MKHSQKSSSETENKNDLKVSFKHDRRLKKVHGPEL